MQKSAIFRDQKSKLLAISYFNICMMYGFVCMKVPVILDATTYSIKLQKRRSLVLECLNQAPVDGSSGSSYGTSASCGSSSKAGALDF